MIALNFVLLTSLLWATETRTELLTVADRGIKRMANSIHPRNHQPPVYEMDRVTHFLKNRVGYRAYGLLLLLLPSDVFYSYSLWLKLNRKRQFSLYLFIRHCQSEYFCHHSHFRFPGSEFQVLALPRSAGFSS